MVLIAFVTITIVIAVAEEGARAKRPCVFLINYNVSMHSIGYWLKPRLYNVLEI